MKHIRIGIIGTGGMANSHAEAYRKHDGVELAACLDVVPGRAEDFARRHGFKHVASSLEDLLHHVDAVSIVTPDRFHAEQSIASLHAGKHLLCEKPLAVSLDEARRVAAAAQAAGVIHMTNFSYRGSAAFQRAIALAGEGQLGELRHVHSFYLQSWLSSDVWGNWTKEHWLWRLQSNGGLDGVLGDIGCHILDLTTAVAGDVERIRCDLRNFPKISPTGHAVTEWDGKKLDANDTAIIEVEFANGAVGIVQATRWASGHANHLRLEAHGTNGALMFDLDRDWNKIDLCLDKDRHRLAWSTYALKPAPTVYERFLRAIRSGKPEQPDILRGAQIQAYLDACLRSAKSGQWETISPWL
jgi:predicted dehydrogenase